MVPRRNSGPLFHRHGRRDRALSVQYTGFGAARELDAFLHLGPRPQPGRLPPGLQFFDVGSQNWAYADVDGNIAYFTSGELPLREDLQAGTVNGAAAVLHPQRHRRQRVAAGAATRSPARPSPYEILPFEEMPQTVNPPAGFFVNANNDPAGVTLDNDPLNQPRPGGGIFYLSVGYAGSAAAASPTCSGPSWPATARCRSPTSSASRPTPPWSTPSSSSPTW